VYIIVRDRVIRRVRVSGIIRLKVIAMVSVRIMIKVKTKGVVLTMLWFQIRLF
jgi:hypothetical protein